MGNLLSKKLCCTCDDEKNIYKKVRFENSVIPESYYSSYTINDTIKNPFLGRETIATFK